MIRHRIVPRPRWWPAQERSEPLTIPPSTGTYLAVGLMTVVALLALEVLIPTLQGARARPPMGILLKGMIEGSLTGITAVALILVYRTNRIINFAQVALGSSAAVVVTQLNTGYDIPFLIAVPFGLAFAVGAGILAELLLRRFFRAPRLVVTLATIALAPALSRMMGTIVSTLSPPPPGVDPATFAVKTVIPPFSNVIIKLPDSPLVFHVVDVATIVGSLLLTAGLMLFLARTRLGRAVRGSAENAEAAWLLGINIRIVATLVWGLAALLAAFASLSSLARSGINTGGGDGGAATLIPALVVAMVAGMELLPMALFAGIWVGMVNEGVRWGFPDLRFFEVGLLAMMLISLFLQRKRLQRRESKAGNAWEAARDVRPTPREMLRLTSVRNGRYLLGGLVGAAIAVYPFVSSAGQIHAAGVVLIYAMIAISLLILTGWAGQISLGQYALVAIGAVVGGGLSQRYGWPFVIAVPAAGITGAAGAMLFGLPALRLRGLYLAAVTLALALAIPVTLFDDKYFGWLLPSGTVPRPQILFLDFNDERSYYYLLLVVTVAVVYSAVRFRRSRPGRVLIALRDNEAAAQSAGLSALSTRIAAFAASGFIAGVAGALLAHGDQTVLVTSFGVDKSVNVLLYLLIGGIGSVSGALLGAAFGGIAVFALPTYSSLLTGLVAFMILLARPDGLAGILYAVRDAILRVIAIRLRIAVPSLFADHDAQAQKHRVMPIAPPIAGRGLNTLPINRRYRRASWVFGRRDA